MIIRTQEDVTPAVLAEIERAPDPRFREMMSALVRHLHAFVREVKLTEEEFQRAARLHRRARPAHHREPQRGRADGGLARRLDAGLPPQQRRQRRRPRPPRTCSARSGGTNSPRDRERRLDRALADAGRADLRQCLDQGPRRQAGRRRRGRCLAFLDRRLLREPGSGAGRHESARQVHHRRRRPHRASAASSRPAIRSRSTGRWAICCARRAAPTCARRTCIS